MKILYIDCDTLRPDHLGCYGYPRNTSPNIDMVAQDGLRFTRYYCSDAPCLPSRAALMTGQFGFHTGVVNHGGTTGDMRLDGPKRDFRDLNSWDNLPYVLRRHGLFTASISTFPERHGAWWFNAGFNEMFNMGKKGNESAEEVTPIALKWLDDNAQREDWFLHLHYWDPHTPLRAPEAFGNPFENDPIPVDWFSPELIEKHRQLAGPHSAQEVYMYHDVDSPEWPRNIGQIRTMEDVKFTFDQYDCGVAWMDENIGMVLDKLRQQGIYDDVAIIVSADHGENLGELGIYNEHGTADQATTNIPFILRWPGAPKNQACNGLHYNVDLLPTLVELLEQHGCPQQENRPPQLQPQRYDGESFAPAVLGGTDDGREYLVVSQCSHVCQRAVLFDHWIYIRTYHDGYHLFPDEMLFDLDSDKAELENLAEQQPRLCRDAVYYLDKWYTQNMAKQAPHCQVDPLWTVIAEGGPYHANGLLKRYCERLRKTGRAEAADQLEKKHPREFM